VGSNCSSCRSQRVAVAAAALVSALLAGAAMATAPPLIDVSVAPLYVGEEVTVEARVEAGRREGNVVRLQLGQPPATLDLLLVEGLLSRFPDAEHRLPGQTIRASGTIREFRGRWEMVVREPQNVAIVGPPGPGTAGETKSTQATIQASPALPPEQPADEVRLQAIETRLDRLERRLEALEKKPEDASERQLSSTGDSFADRLRKLEIRLRQIESRSQRRP
jgi:hypothetical protein